MERRTLIRLLVGLGIGIPVAVEGATFLGLFGARLSGGEAETPTRTPTPAADRVGVGDEVLPAMPATETLTTATIRGGGDRWLLTLTAEVENDTGGDYQFSLGQVTLENGRTVEGGASSDRIAPGETATVTGRWELPPGSTPATVAVTAISFAGGGTPRTASRSVRLAPIPVQGG